MGKSALIVLAVVCLAGTARAVAPVDAPLGVVFEDCKDAPLGTATFLRALALELGNAANPGGDRATPQIAVRFGCNGVALIQIATGQSSEVRAVRLDDVPVGERPRALALVIAELVQGRAWAAPDVPPKASSQSITPLVPQPPAGADAIPSQGNPFAARHTFKPRESSSTRTPHNGKTKLSYWCGVGARLSSGVGNPNYGGQAGVGLGMYRLQGDSLFSHATVSRGSISAGLAAARLRRALPLFASPNIEIELGLGGALGATWSLGASNVPGTIAKRVLAPYADVRVGAALVLPSVPGFAPGVELYVGRAAGIVSRANGVAALATGGWFIGLEAGIRR